MSQSLHINPLTYSKKKEKDNIQHSCSNTYAKAINKATRTNLYNTSPVNEKPFYTSNGWLYTRFKSVN